MKAVTFGEIMMRLNPEGYLRFVQANSFEVSYAGGEANVAVSLANYGVEAAFVSKVPAHEIGQCVVNELRRYGVDTKYLLRGGPRLGVYYCEKGASQRASKVIYDRAGSAIAKAAVSEFDWDAIFENAAWFHWTGITPALGGELPEICLEACKAAKAHGVTISCDLNFRKKLWTSAQANAVMSKLMPYVDVCIANEEDAKDVFGIAASGTDIAAGKLSREGYRSVAEQWELSFPRDALAEHTIRYLPPEEVSMDHCAVFVRRSDGTWQPVETTSMGSYLLFTAEGENVQLAVLTTAAVWWLWAIFLALIAAAVFFIVRVVHRKRGKKAAKPGKKENGAAG